MTITQNMTALHLSEAEKEQLTHWLSARSRAGGWVFISLAGFVLFICLWLAIRTIFTVTPYAIDDFVPLVTILLVMVGIGVWLLRQRRVIRRLFNESLHVGRGRIINRHLDPSASNHLQVEIDTISGEVMVARVGYMGTSDWQAGDEIELIFWQDGRFCPRHVTHLVDFSHLPTPQRRRRIRNRIILVIVWYLLAVALAILFGLYGQGRL